MSTDKIVGIDLGTTNSAVAILEGGDPTIIPNRDGDRTTPSVVAFTDEDEQLVGRQARNQMVQNPGNTVDSIKRHMGEEGYKVELQGEMYTPEEISAMILRELKETAGDYLGYEPERAVITTPAYFNDKQRQATKDAGEIAGFDVERIVNEPTAAAMAYGLSENDEEKTVLVYDLGGGTFDVSILHISDDIYDVLVTDGDNELGGNDWTQVLVDHVVDTFEDEHGIDLRNDKQALQRVRDASEKAKKELTSRNTTTINLPFVTATDDGPIHLEQDITRSKFEEMTQHLVDRTTEPTQNALDEAGYDIEDLDDVLLVGGATRMPMIRDTISKGRQSINPEEVVSLGAAIQGGIISGEVKDTILLDVTPLSLGVEVKGGLFKSLIKRNTTIPVEESNVFTTAKDNQTSVDIRVYQGEREIAEENEFLGEFTLAGIPPAPAGTPEIQVNFSIDENGIVNVEAEDRGSGKTEDITIEGGVGLTEEEIEEMRSEAEAYAEEDREKREAVRARNEGERMVRDAQRFLDDHEEEIDPDRAAKLREQVDKLESILDSDESDTTAIVEGTSNLSITLQKAGGEIHRK